MRSKSRTQMQQAHLLLWLALAASLFQAASGQMSQYRQHNNILDFQVPENAPSGYYLGQVRSADGRVPSLILPIKPTLESDLIAALQYNSSTGDLHTSASLDREQRERYQFLAIVTEQFIEVRCTVRVTDLNDNAPTFLMAQNETHVLIEVEEGQTGIRRPLPPAYDLDSPLYGIQQFQLMDVKHRKRFALVEHGAPARSTTSVLDDSPFSAGNGSLQAAMAGENPHLMNQLDQLASVLIPSQASQQAPQASASTMGGSSQSAIAPQSSAPQSVALAAAAVATAASNTPHPKYFYIDLEVNEPLDRENQSMYGLDVTVEDKGVIPMVSKLKIILKVLDINDNDPIFVEKLYECRVKEDELINTKLLRVEARDADEGANANIIYSIRNHTSTTSQSILNPSDNNEVSTPTAATGGRFSGNKRTMQQQSFMAQQVSNGKLTLRSQQQDHSSIEQLASSSGKQFNSKQTAVGSNLATATAAGTTVQEPLFHIDPIKGDIILIHSLDYETDQMHELVVEARDQGKPSRATTTIVRVFVLDVMDDPPVQGSYIQSNSNNDKFNSAQAPSIESAKLSPAQGGDVGDTGASGYFQNFNLLTWFAQINSSVLFIFVLVALIIVAFPVCFVKIKSRQPESDYNDTAGLTLTSNNCQTKQSPNHSSGGHGGDGTLNGDGGHGHHRRINGSFAGLSGDGTFGGVGGKSRYQFSDSSNLYYNLYPPQQSRHHHHNNNHLHHQQVPPPSDSPGNHQMAASAEGGGTMTLQNHHHALLGAPGGGGGIAGINNGGGGSGGHHSLEHHQFTQAGHHHHHSGHHPNHHHNHHHQQSPPPHHSSSLTYGHHHSRAAAALLHQAHHHQSSHHLSSAHQNAVAQNGAGLGSGLGVGGSGCGVGGNNNNNNANSNKGGTMNSIGTHHSGIHPSGSPLPTTPNTTNSSGLPPPNHLSNPGILLPPLVPSSGQPPQLPPTPCHVGASVFSWPQTPTSTLGGANCPLPLVTQPNPGHLAGGGASIHGSTLDCTPTALQVAGGSNTLPPAWIDLGTSQTQPPMAHDLYGSYNWDYLSDWAPEYNTLMQLIQADGSY